MLTRFIARFCLLVWFFLTLTKVLQKQKKITSEQEEEKAFISQELQVDMWVGVCVII